MKENPKYATAIDDYIKACNSMLHSFCYRHGFLYEQDCWVGGEPGGMASIGDFFFDMATIWYDVTEEPDTEELLKWQDYCCRLYALGVKKDINFRSWCMGAPRMSEESLERMESLKAELDR